MMELQDDKSSDTNELDNLMYTEIGTGEIDSASSMYSYLQMRPACCRHGQYQIDKTVQGDNAIHGQGECTTVNAV